MTVRINVFNMTFPARKKRRYIEKSPGGEVDEIWPYRDDPKYPGEETDEPFRIKGID